MDLSSTNTGVVILDEFGTPLEVALISPNKSLKFDDRVVKILEELVNLFSSYKNEYELCVAIESGALYGKGKRNELAMLNGAVYYFLRFNKIETHLVPPSRLKKYATGNGRASKEDMANSAPKKFRERVESLFKKADDVIDAYFLAKYCKCQE